MEQEKEVIEAEVVEKDSKQEKSQNAFSKFWNKTKKSFNDAILDSKIESAYNSSHDEFGIYEKDALLSTTVHGELNGLTLDIFSTLEVKPFSVIISKKDKKAYYIISSSKIEVRVTLEGIEHICQGTRLELKDDLQEVNVIKADGRYFIYKG